jgi:hypothetical protein
MGHASVDTTLNLYTQASEGWRALPAFAREIASELRRARA